MKLEQMMASAPVIPVIVIDRVADAVPLARALVAGGLPVLEVTLRTEVALQAVAKIAAEVDDAIVGIGTLTRPQQFAAARAAGAVFAVSPGLTDELATAARQTDLPLLPGVFTPSEAMTAQALGFNALKLFPAKPAGGIGMLKAMSGPLPDLLFCPTGGIGAEDFRDFLALPNVACVGGSWVCPRELVAAGDWSTIESLAAAASAAASAAAE